MDPHLHLAAVEGCGPGMIPALLDPELDARRALRAPPPLPRAAGRRLTDPRTAEEARRWAEEAERSGLRILTPTSPSYPPRLRHAALRPLVLFARGDAGVLTADRPHVAVVGSRTPTPYGLLAADDFCGRLAAAGAVLWSGLAIGIDGRAHRACLEHGTPTVAVLAGGLDAVYPPSHAALAEDIVAAGGVLLSEAPPGRRAVRGHFPRRNRILAAATLGTLVVEAGTGSGTLHTARFAADAGALVLAVPGPYTSPRSRGCHHLIAEGAQVAGDPEQVLRALGMEASLAGGTGGSCEHSADEAAVVRVLQRGPRPADLVEREARLEHRTFLEAVHGLVGRGQVRWLAGGLLGLTGALPGTDDISR